MVPVIGTITLLAVIYNLLQKCGDKLIQSALYAVNFTFGTDYQSSDIPEFIHLALPLGLIYLIGFAVLRAPGKRLLGFLDSLMQKIPFLGFIYRALKQFVDSVRNLGGRKQFKGVAYVEYPSPGCKLLGFITGSYTEADGNEVTSIFVPTSPNPASGLIIIVDNDKVQPSSLSLEEAGKLILSAGIVNPSEPQTQENQI